MVTPDEDDNNNNNNEKEKEKENAMMMMGGRTLSLITEEDMLLEFEQMQKKMNLSKKKNLTIRVEPRDSIGDGKNDKKNASNNKDGSDSHRSSSTNNEDEDEDGSPTDLENTVHLTDKFLTDRSTRRRRNDARSILAKTRRVEGRRSRLRRRKASEGKKERTRSRCLFLTPGS